MANDSTVVVRPAQNVSGSLRLPGDKSICHRYAMLGAIAEGDTRHHVEKALTAACDRLRVIIR